MGLIKAAVGSVGGVLADQWKEYFYCDSISENILAVKGQKRTSSRSSNTKGSDNIISNGSVIAIADGQCMLIVEQGKVVDVCAEPGEYIYDISTEPSIFSGKLGKSIIDTFKTIGKRFTFGGDTGKDQRVYYFNTKELIGNKYGTPSPVPFRVVDQRAGIDIDISIRCFGEYSYHISNPLLFYTNICGNVEEAYNRSTIDSQLKTELLTALQPAFARISEMGIRYSALPGHTQEMADALNEILSAKWRDLRGIEIVSFGVSAVKASEEDEAMLKEMQKNAAYRDPGLGAATLIGAQAEAMKAAAANSNAGPAMAFMGMNMAQNAGGGNIQDLYNMAANYQPPAPATPATPAAPVAPTAPVASATSSGDSWTCQCGATVSGKFCTECGNKKPEMPAASWTCTKCGTVNKGKFCSECGEKKPAAAAQYKCDKCGWEPEDKTKPPKFCPECGDKFDNDDII